MKTMSPRAQYLLQALNQRFENLPSREEERQALSRGARKVVAQKRQAIRGWRRRIAADPAEARRAKALLEKQLADQIDRLAWANAHPEHAGCIVRAEQDHKALLEALDL